MNNEEAIAVLDEELAKFEIQVFWDDRLGGNVRVLGSIDNGGWRAFVPVNRDFIKAPDGSFVGD